MGSGGAVDRARVLALVLSCLSQVMAEAKKAPAGPLDEASRLVGRGAVVDSLGMVSLVADLELRIEQELGAVVALAQDSGASDAASPFVTVGSLTDYLCGLIATAPR